MEVRFCLAHTLSQGLIRVNGKPGLGEGLELVLQLRIKIGVAVDSGMGAGLVVALQAGESREDNALRRSLRVTAHSLGKGFDLRLRFPRPVYYVSAEQKRFGTTTVQRAHVLTINRWNRRAVYFGYVVVGNSGVVPTSQIQRVIMTGQWLKFADAKKVFPRLIESQYRSDVDDE